MSVKFSFDAKKFEKDIKKAIEKDLINKPEQVLRSHVGEIVSSECPQCGGKEIQILSDGKGKCILCNKISKIDIDLRWK